MIASNLSLVSFYRNPCVIFKTSLRQEEETIKECADWAEMKGKPGVLLKELYQYGPSDVRSKEMASTMLKVLEEHGRAFPVPAHEINLGAKGKAWRFI